MEVWVYAANVGDVGEVTGDVGSKRDHHILRRVVVRFACCFAKYVIQDRYLNFIASQFEIVAKDLLELLVSLSLPSLRDR